MNLDCNQDYQGMSKGFLRGTSLTAILAMTLSSGASAWAQSRPATDRFPDGQSGVTVPSPERSSAPIRDPINQDPLPVQTSTSTTSTSTSRSERDVAANQRTLSSNSPRFFCQLWKGQYTVMYSPEKSTGESYPWAIPQQLGGGWGPEKRCVEISRRLEEYRPDGLLEMSTATENGYNTVCATTQSRSACRIVFTVPPGQDPIATRNSVFSNLTTADNGQMTQGVNTFVGNRSENLNLNGDLVNLGLAILGQGSSVGSSSTSGLGYSSAINLKPYLAPSDGGTGRQLTNGVRLQRGLRLQPDKFR